jgi:hypothetical protein
VAEQRGMLVDLDAFIAAVRQHEPTKADHEKSLGKAFDPIDPWFAHLFNLKSHVEDLELMIYSARREVIILGSLGLFQPAILALRSFYELAHSWPYYAEHPREWLEVKGDNDNVYFDTPGRGERNMRRLISGLEVRLRILRSHLKVSSPYGELSKYAHSSNAGERLIIERASDIVRGRNEITMLRRLTEESVDYLAAWYCAVLSRDHWTELPPELRKWIADRVPSDKLALFR